MPEERSSGRGDRTPGRRPGGRGQGSGASRGGDSRPGARGSSQRRDGGPRREGEQRGERKPYEKRDGERKPYEKRDGERKPYERRDDDRPRHDDPEIPRWVDPRDLDKAAYVELKGLSKENAERVAKHLVAAAGLLADDPQLAHKHALAASRTAGRIGVVRETVGITAYAVGDFARALRELRTYRRITGSNEQIALIVDSERGMGRPQKGLDDARGVNVASLPTPARVALAIAKSGARLDLGQTDLALAELEIAELDPNRAFEWSPDLFRAYAEVLGDLGRAVEAADWLKRAEVAEEALAEEMAAHDVVEVLELNDRSEELDARWAAKMAAEGNESNEGGEVDSGDPGVSSGETVETDEGDET